MTTEFSLDEARERLAELLDRAEAGEEIVITRFGVPSVSLEPASRQRVPTGAIHGVIGGVAAAQVLGADAAFDVGTDYWSTGDVG